MLSIRERELFTVTSTLSSLESLESTCSSYLAGRLLTSVSTSSSCLSLETGTVLSYIPVVLRKDTTTRLHSTCQLSVLSTLAYIFLLTELPSGGSSHLLSIAKATTSHPNNIPASILRASVTNGIITAWEDSTAFLAHCC